MRLHVCCIFATELTENNTHCWPRPEPQTPQDRCAHACAVGIAMAVLVSVWLGGSSASPYALEVFTPGLWGVSLVSQRVTRTLPGCLNKLDVSTEA